LQQRAINNNTDIPPSHLDTAVRFRCESVIASGFVFSRKILCPATFDFCNTIVTNKSSADAMRT